MQYTVKITGILTDFYILKSDLHTEQDQTCNAPHFFLLKNKNTGMSSLLKLELLKIFF